jgi:hypothetical protein
MYRDWDTYADGKSKSKHYAVVCYMRPRDGVVDLKYEDALDEAVGRESSGSGFCNVTMQRDISWLYKQEKAAMRCLAKLKRRSRVIRVDVWELDSAGSSTVILAGKETPKVTWKRKE